MVKRLLHFSLLIFAFALYGIGVNIISGVLAEPAQEERITAQDRPLETPTTTSTIAELVTTTTTTMTVPPLSSAQLRKLRVQASTTAPKQQSTTTTTEAPKTPLKIAQSQVGKTGPYAEGGFWCAKFVSWVAEQAKVEGWCHASRSWQGLILV